MNLGLPQDALDQGWHRSLTLVNHSSKGFTSDIAINCVTKWCVLRFVPRPQLVLNISRPIRYPLSCHGKSARTLSRT